MLDGRESLFSLRSESILPLEDAIVGEMIMGARFRLARRLALYIASSAASKITLPRRCPWTRFCSSAIDCFLRSFSGRVRNQETSADEIDDLVLDFRGRPFGGPLVEVCRNELTARGCFNLRRSARESRLRSVRSNSSDVIEPEFCANLSLSRVEKYCRPRCQLDCKIISSQENGQQLQVLGQRHLVTIGASGSALQVPVPIA
jgi:hypothetical protein